MNGIIIQKGTAALCDKLTVRKKVRSTKAPTTEIEPYFNAKKGLPSLKQHFSGDDFNIHDDDFHQIPGRNLDSTDIGCVVPGWTGFNTKLVREIPQLSNIGYLPVVDNPATDLATMNTILKKKIG